MKDCGNCKKGMNGIVMIFPPFKRGVQLSGICQDCADENEERRSKRLTRMIPDDVLDSTYDLIV